jgi:hypothetical protein
VVHLAEAGLILGDSHFSGDFALSVRAVPSPGHDSLLDFGGSRLTMRNVRVKGTSTDTSEWAGDLTLTQGHLALDSPKLDGELVLRARDASPILGAMFRNSLPRWVAGWTRMQSLTALSHVVVEPHELAVSDLIAAGGDISVRGTYALRRGAKGDGAFVVHKGPWSAGLDVDAGESHVRLFDLDRWYRGRVRAILGAASAGFPDSSPCHLAPARSASLDLMCVFARPTPLPNARAAQVDAQNPALEPPSVWRSTPDSRVAPRE